MTHLIANRLLASGCTDVGSVRTLNEDNYRISQEAGVLIVADGMGGHDAGEVASAHVIEMMMDYLSRPLPDDEEVTIVNAPGLRAADPEAPTIVAGEEDLWNTDDIDTLESVASTSSWKQLSQQLIKQVGDAIVHTNEKINEINQERGYYDGSGMGSTLVGLWMPPGFSRAVVFHVGDSRLYLMRAGEGLKRVTQDHTLYQQWLDFGSQGRPPAQNVILQAMGPVEQVVPDIQLHLLSPGDRVLLCTDGLTGMIGDDLIEEQLRGLQRDNLDQVCRHLIELAKKQGGKDNITVIVGLVTD
ncbi:MAG: serine/threonine-protein phosphatase [Magnetococcales bacterium]|nr:serine/threonine-protein phosphatase [Magnetococcales bacterium]